MEMDELDKLKTKRDRIRVMATDVLQMIDREIQKANITGCVDIMDECMSLLMAKGSLLAELNSKIEQEIRDKSLYDEEVRISESWSETIVQYKSKINQLMKKIPLKRNFRQLDLMPSTGALTNPMSLPFISNYPPINLQSLKVEEQSSDSLKDDECLIVGTKFQAGNLNVKTSIEPVPLSRLSTNANSYLKTSSCIIGHGRSKSSKTTEKIFRASSSLDKEAVVIDIDDSDDAENIKVSDKTLNIVPDSSTVPIKKEPVPFEVDKDICQQLSNKIVWIDDDSEVEVDNTCSDKTNQPNPNVGNMAESSVTVSLNADIQRSNDQETEPLVLNNNESTLEALTIPASNAKCTNPTKLCVGNSVLHGINDTETFQSKESVVNRLELSPNPILNSAENVNESVIEEAFSRLIAGSSPLSVSGETAATSNDHLNKKSNCGSLITVTSECEDVNKSAPPIMDNHCNIVYRKLNKPGNSNFHIYERPKEPLNQHNIRSAQDKAKNSSNMDEILMSCVNTTNLNDLPERIQIPKSLLAKSIKPIVLTKKTCKGMRKFPLTSLTSLTSPLKLSDSISSVSSTNNPTSLLLAANLISQSPPLLTKPSMASPTIDTSPPKLPAVSVSKSYLSSNSPSLISKPPFSSSLHKSSIVKSPVSINSNTVLISATDSQPLTIKTKPSSEIQIMAKKRKIKISDSPATENAQAVVKLRNLIPENFANPLKLGFTRELVFRTSLKEKKQFDVYYRTPGPKRIRLRSRVQVIQYLLTSPIQNLIAEDFTFSHSEISQEPYEVVLNANKLSKRKSVVAEENVTTCNGNETQVSIDFGDKQLANLLPTKSRSKRMNKCEDCDMIFSVTAHFLKHRLEVHGDRNPFKCYYCNFATNIYGNLMTHQSRRICRKSNIIKFNKCADCHKSFKSEKRLVNHCLDVHNDALPFHCKMCDFRTDEKHELLTHLKHHAEKKTVLCQNCGRLISSSKIKYHQRLKKKYNCELCQRHFCFKGDLQNHTKKHNSSISLDRVDEANACASEKDDLPFECEYCKELFLEKEAYTTHCDNCDAIGDDVATSEDSFSPSKHILPRGSLRIHKRLHGLVKHPQCEYC